MTANKNTFEAAKMIELALIVNRPQRACELVASRVPTAEAIEKLKADFRAGCAPLNWIRWAEGLPKN